MNERSALKKAKDVFDYIEKESGYTASDPILRRVVTRRIALTIRANEEVSQRYIESLVRVFKVLRRYKEERAGTISAKDLPAHFVETTL